jgi:porin
MKMDSLYRKITHVTITLRTYLLQIGGLAVALVLVSEPAQANCLDSRTNGLMTCDRQTEVLPSSPEVNALAEMNPATEDAPDHSLVPLTASSTYSQSSQLSPAEGFESVELSIAQGFSGANNAVEAVPTDLAALNQSKISTQATDLSLTDGKLIAQHGSKPDGSAEPIPATPAQPETPSAAPADAAKSGGESFWTRSHLTGDNWRSKLRERGVSFELEFTQFYQGLGAGTGSKEFDYGGRLDALINLDTGKLGLWKGGGLHTHLEYRYGWLPAFQDGILLPVNTGQLLPLRSRDTVVASSLYFSQKFGDRVSLLIGKINAVDLLAGDLFFGGWGTQRFMNIAFVAPPSGVVPPTIIGAIATIKTKPVAFTLMVFDPNDRTKTYWPNDLFSDGVNVSLGATHAGTISGRPTTYGLTATYSSKEGVDLNDVLLPPELQVNSTKTGSYNVAFQFTHLLRQNPTNPREGWGLFFKAAIADGNPNPFQRSLVLGLGGKGLISGRSQDSFGLGFYFYDFSNALEDAVDPLVNFGDEYGMEVYYSYAVTPWFYLTGDLQVIRPANQDSALALVLGLRARLRL